MIKKLTIALLAIFALSACSTGHNKGMSADSTLISDFQNNVGDRVFFAFDSSDLSSDAKAQLEKQTTWLIAHPNVKATIEGHCDTRGTVEYNLALGERRADEVRKFLQGKGIDASRLDTISYGKERPAVIGNDQAAHKQNRRGVTSIR